MAVLLETSLGEVCVDLRCDEAPLAAKNFLKLCKLKYYHNHLFYNVQQNYLAQAGDPTAKGDGGMSIYGLCKGPNAHFFDDETSATVKHDRRGLLCMANAGVPNSNSSQFFFTLRGDDLEHLDGKHTIFGDVAEDDGMKVLDRLNAEYVDENGRPFRDIRILHTHVLEDPFEVCSSVALLIPPSSLHPQLFLPWTRSPHCFACTRPFGSSFDSCVGSEWFRGHQTQRRAA